MNESMDINDDIDDHSIIMIIIKIIG